MNKFINRHLNLKFSDITISCASTVIIIHVTYFHFVESKFCKPKLNGKFEEGKKIICIKLFSGNNFFFSNRTCNKVIIITNNLR